MGAVYALKDPRDGTLFYVGATHYTVHQRLVQHRSSSRLGIGPPVSARIGEILAAGLQPEAVCLKRTENLRYWERYWMDRLRREGNALTNVVLPKRRPRVLSTVRAA